MSPTREPGGFAVALSFEQMPLAAVGVGRTGKRVRDAVRAAREE